MITTAYQKPIALSSHALFWHEFFLIKVQILYEATNNQSSVGSADGAHLEHL